jgi:hypothetical protein
MPSLYLSRRYTRFSIRQGFRSLITSRRAFFSGFEAL